MKYTQEMRDKLETIMDASSVQSMLDMMATICELKADHIRENWQDQQTARVWDQAARALRAASKKVFV